MLAHRDEQCPRRGPALTHIQDILRQPDGRCVYCLTTLRVGEEAPEPPVPKVLWSPDKPMPGVCGEDGGHLSIGVYRGGHPDRPYFLCFPHLARLVQTHGSPPPPHG